MKTLKLKLACLLLGLLSVPVVARAQGTAFTYNGRLNNNGAPVNGSYDMRFTIYDASAGNNVIAGPLTLSPVDVANGLFTVRMDFGAGVFTGPARWLNVEIQPTGGGGFVALTPRQEVTSSPYSIQALTAGSVVAGGVGANQLDTGGVGPASGQILSYNGGNLFWTDPGVAAGGIWSRLNNNAYYSAGNVGIGNASPVVRLDTRSASASSQSQILAANQNANTWVQLWSGFGNGANPPAIIWPTNQALRFIGGSLDGNTATEFMRIDNNGNLGIGTASPTPGVRLEVNGTTKVNGGGSGGYVYFHTPSGESGMSIIGANRADVRFDGSSLKLLAGFGPGAMPSDNGITVDTSGNVGVGKVMNFGSTPRQMFNLFGTGFGVGVQTADLYFRSGGGFAWHVGGTHNDATYNSGGGTTVATLDLTTGLDFGSRLGQQLTLWGGVSSRRFAIGVQDSTLYSRCGGDAADGFVWYKGGVYDSRYHNGGGGQTLMTLDSNGVFVGGPASVCVLTIRGGCDIAEPFPMKEKELEKGSVVVIDGEHPGQLKLSTEAYDTRVAGIVSGANGVNAGIALHQEGVLDGGQNVALSGRVYVQADAAFGAIQPGDLLTTSATPGHAMKVTDHAQAQGAILGKAMSALAQGQGMVLVLVTLQ